MGNTVGLCEFVSMTRLRRKMRRMFCWSSCILCCMFMYALLYLMDSTGAAQLDLMDIMIRHTSWMGKAWLPNTRHGG